MKIIIDHDNCEHADSYSERCLYNTIMDPIGHERFCMMQRIDDGKEELTIVLLQDGKTYTRVIDNEVDREIVASEGWAGFAEAKAAS